MNSFDLDIISEKERAGSEFMFRIAQELQRAFLAEKTAHKITQQSIADQLDTSRAVINRQLQGLENIGSRRIGELFWALGYEPYFEARKIPERDNEFCVLKAKEAAQPAPAPVPPQKLERIIGEPDPAMRKLWEGLVSKSSPVPVS
jgi:hypothetical protein